MSERNLRDAFPFQDSKIKTMSAHVSHFERGMQGRM